jgi:hypothetical protein
MWVRSSATTARYGWRKMSFILDKEPVAAECLTGDCTWSIPIMSRKLIDEHVKLRHGCKDHDDLHAEDPRHTSTIIHKL